MSQPGASTPRSFNVQASSAEDILKNQTVGLVHLDEFRKRRRDVEDLKGKETPTSSDGALTPKSDDGVASHGTRFKKRKRKAATHGLLSFGNDEDEAEAGNVSRTAQIGVVSSAKSSSETSDSNPPAKRTFTSNPKTGLPAPKAITKASLAADAEERERLRKDFIAMQEQVRSSEIAIPFVLYDGADSAGGTVRVKKGEHIWLLLERCRKVGAEMGVSSGDNAGPRSTSHGKKSWARIGVDDLMLIRGETIVPHHYEFYYFIANKVPDPANPARLLFDYTGTIVKKQSSEEDTSLLHVPKNERIEGQDADPSYTKVVDRRWYERNKHIYPASLWRDYTPGKEFDELSKGRRDVEGNSFFFS